MTFMVNTIYNAQFFTSQMGGSSRSALAVAPVLVEMLQPQSVVDIGCGVGTWLSAFRENGVREILGIDGDYVDRKQLKIPADRFMSMDLRHPVASIGQEFDLAICLEVAEHLPESSASRLVNFISGLAPVVFFSAAVPGQGGADHVNEQWPDYWSRHFAKHGYKMLDLVRPRIWNMDGVEPWYCQNSFLYVREDKAICFPGLRAEIAKPVGLPERLIHPELFRRFVSLEYIQTKQLACELAARIKRKLRRIASTR